MGILFEFIDGGGSMILEQKKFFGIDLENIENIKRVEEGLNRDEEVLVFGTNDGVYVWDGRTIMNIAKRDGWVITLAVLNGVLYDGGRYGKIYNTFKNKVVAERDKEVTALAVLNGELYDGGVYGIRRTLDGRVIFEGKPVVSMISVPRSVLRGLR
jgi:hypothetical protein